MICAEASHLYLYISQIGLNDFEKYVIANILTDIAITIWFSTLEGVIIFTCFFFVKNDLWCNFCEYV